ncbi:MAG: hypothetical protein ACK41D_05700 [Rubricoccaceae bacterium]
MRRLLPLLLTLVLVAGCDTTGPVDEALVGTWTLVSTGATDLVTVAEAQTVTAYDRPPLSGALTLSGAVTGSLRHVGAFQRSGAGAFVRLQSVPQGQEGPSTVSVVLQSSGGEGGLFAGDRFLPLSSFEGDAPFGLSPGVLDVPRVTFAAGAEEAVASGRLTFATRTLAANRETAVGSERVTPTEAGYTVRYAFEGNNRLVVTETAGPERRETRGRWDVVGEGALRIVLTEGNTRTSFILGYTLSGNDLTLLGYEEEFCPPDCQEAIATTYGLRAESLLRYRVERSYRFTRASALRPARVPADGLPATPGLRPHPLALPGREVR